MDEATRLSLWAEHCLTHRLLEPGPDEPPHDWRLPSADERRSAADAIWARTPANGGT